MMIAYEDLFNILLLTDIKIINCIPILYLNNLRHFIKYRNYKP